MDKEILTFGNIEIEKKWILPTKDSYFRGNVDIEKVIYPTRFILVKKNFRYFIGYLHSGNKVKPLN